MNYSVGFRAPNTRELISGFADYVLQRELGGNYYSDPDVPPRAHPADVLPQEMDKLREMMLELINQPEHFKQWFGEFISQSRHELDIAPPEPPYQPDEIYDALKQGEVLVRLGGLRVLRIGDDVYANGEKIDSPHRPALDALASNIALTAENFGDALEDPSFLAMLAALVNSGYWSSKGKFGFKPDAASHAASLFAYFRCAVNSAIRTITCTAFSIPSRVTNSCLP